ncbi:MAG: magnesium transporter CorA family protein [Lentimicrobiaceae bacterium]|nr:magnesium transporter CorA family protein [Lentimicrobiaceae bacterium]
MIETIKIGTLKWHHSLSPTDADLQYLLDNFHFHPLDIEDCKSFNQRPKIDIYDDYYFIILHFPYFDRENKFLKIKEVKIFWGKDYIITIGQSHWVVKIMFNQAKERPEESGILDVGTSDALLYKILERLMTETLSLINKIGNEVDFINRDLFVKRAERIIERISVTRKNIILLNTIFKPQLRLFHKFESGEIEGYAENMEEYWGNILDYYQKMWDLTEDYQEMIEGLAKTFDSLQTNKINEIMKVLTFFSSIMLPLTFITGLYGMNIGLPFQSHPNSFWIVVSFMVFVIFALIYFFKRMRWM